jgi:hypothetical protein
MTQTKTTKRRGGGGKLTRSEQVSIRLDPKLRFAAELAASKERRTLSSFIEWAVERAVKEIPLVCREGQWQTADVVTHNVWDLDEAYRFSLLGMHYPELLTYEDQKLWKFICEFGVYVPAIGLAARFINPEKKGAFLNLIQPFWEEIKACSAGRFDRSELDALVVDHIINLPENQHLKDKYGA